MRQRTHAALNIEHEMRVFMEKSAQVLRLTQNHTLTGIHTLHTVRELFSPVTRQGHLQLVEYLYRVLPRQQRNP